MKWENIARNLEYAGEDIPMVKCKANPERVSRISDARARSVYLK